MTLSDWDRHVAGALHAIKSSAFWASYHARDITTAMNIIVCRPDWPTQAEDALETAERDLNEALERVKAARRAYRSKPLEAAA